MAILIAKPMGASLSYVDLLKICGQENFSEMGVTLTYGADLERHVEIESLYEIPELANEYCTALIYLDNPCYNFSESGRSPLMCGPDISFAMCGEVLSLSESNKGRSNNEVFNEQTLMKVYDGNPNVIFSKSFRWLMMKLVRSFVGGVFLDKFGNFCYINQSLFKYDASGCFFMDSEESEKACDGLVVNKPDLATCFD